MVAAALLAISIHASNLDTTHVDAARVAGGAPRDRGGLLIDPTNLPAAILKTLLNPSSVEVALADPSCGFDFCAGSKWKRLSAQDAKSVGTLLLSRGIEPGGSRCLFFPTLGYRFARAADRLTVQVSEGCSEARVQSADTTITLATDSRSLVKIAERYLPGGSAIAP